jgi:hypothetical protein
MDQPGSTLSSCYPGIMPDTTPHECPIVAAARLSSKRKDDEEWEVLDISMSKQPFRNNVHGISYEQHDNKNLADGKYLSYPPL